MTTTTMTTFMTRILLISSLIILTNIPSSLAVPNVHVINDLPKDSDPCYIGVKPMGNGNSLIGVQDFALRQGEEADIGATNNNIYTAVFQWKDMEGEVEAYSPKRDAGKNNIYWKISADGFLLGYEESMVTNKVSSWKKVDSN